jgi:hypothetical protein
MSGYTVTEKSNPRDKGQDKVVDWTAAASCMRIYSNFESYGRTLDMYARETGHGGATEAIDAANDEIVSPRDNPQYRPDYHRNPNPTESLLLERVVVALDSQILGTGGEKKNLNIDQAHSRRYLTVRLSAGLTSCTFYFLFPPSGWGRRAGANQSSSRTSRQA